MFYSGDEYADEDCTSGPIPEPDRPLTVDEIDAERQATEDEYDEMYPQGESR